VSGDENLDVEVDGRRLRFEPSVAVTVGRDPASSVVLTDPRVSRAHATVLHEDGGWVWHDSSSAGSYRGGQRVTAVAVDAPMTIRLGDPDEGPEVRLSVSDGTPSVVDPAADQGRLEVGYLGAAHVVVQGTTCTVGRSPDSTIVIEDPRVARSHLSIAHEGEHGWVVTDQDTGWGTWCNASRITRLAVAGPLVLQLASSDDGPTLMLRPMDEHVPVPSGSQLPGTQLPGSHVLGSQGLGPQPSSDRLGGGLSRVVGPGSFSIARSVPVGVTRIGRAADNDIVIDDDLTVALNHAELHRHLDRLEVVDLGTQTGTYVDGTRVERATVVDGSVVGVGRHLFVLEGGELAEFVDDSAGLAVRELTVNIDGRDLVHQVTIAVEPGQVVAVVGPTGAGKSTLLKALTGFQPATSGQVLYNGRDLYATFDELRHRIGYVPQDDILHSQLTLRAALGFAAELRFASDTSAALREARVNEVIEELGLSERADLVIDKLSGGQRKRASVALELLTRPALLFLDEPTSGLDPGYERSVMELLRELADGGRTVLVITHAVASLDLCDRVLFLAPGGRMAYYGPPAEALEFFGARDYAEVFHRLDAERTDWPAALQADPAWERYVAEPAQRMAVVPTRTVAPPAAPKNPPFGQQLGTLVRRNLAVLRASGGYATLLVAQAPVIALLLLLSLQTGNLQQDSASPRPMVLVIVIAACAMGFVNSCREIVRELAIYKRERTVGLSLLDYLASKLVCLSILAAAQTFILTIVVIAPQSPSADPVLLGSVVVELMVVVFLTMMATLAIGLAVSALVETDSAALVLVPVLIVSQLVLANGMIDISSTPGLAQASLVQPGRWGFSAAASSADLLHIEKTCAFGPVSPDVKSVIGDAPCSTEWTHDAAHFVTGLFALVAITAAFTVIAAWALRRRDPIGARRTPP
jgi:ABC-type multidrug transport system ATPase subunit